VYRAGHDDTRGDQQGRVDVDRLRGDRDEEQPAGGGADHRLHDVVDVVDRGDLVGHHLNEEQHRDERDGPPFAEQGVGLLELQPTGLLGRGDGQQGDVGVEARRDRQAE
jgi:hypothetical protein